MTDTATPLEDARPLVARPINNRSIWLFAVGAGLAAILLFSALEARRVDRTGHGLSPAKAQDGAMIEPPPPLAIPDAAQTEPVTFAPIASSPTPFVQVPVPRVVQQAPAGRRSGSTNDSGFAPPTGSPSYARSQVLAGPALVYQAPPAGPGAPGIGTAVRETAQRVHASRFESPATTIPQGSVIQAVLETALDSTKAGPARAIVSRDVRGFDGTKVLIPRGSRLYGEYKADLSDGQSRAMIQWTRLMRPDGVVMSLDSPSADPLGRAGVQGKVNTHFLTRFGNAFLQSTLNLGVGLATRSVGGGTVVLGLPGSTQTIAPASDSIKPTLKVAQGAPVSVFVARDLDFTEVER